MKNHLLAVAVTLVLSASLATAWTSNPANRHSPRPNSALRVSTAVEFSTQDSSTLKPVFDFSKAAAVESFERIDDVIMGGISTSRLEDVTGEGYAKWSGVCRTDGGGFCGMRTRPLKEPIAVGDADGLYLACRLVSDDEPERRIFKMTTRVESTRGEVLYSTMFSFKNNGDEWVSVKIPFESFRLVRGPSLIPDSPPLNVTGGLFQVGMTLTKFVLGENATVLENFRAGFFEMQLKEIGLYKEEAATAMDTLASPQILCEEEAKRQRSLVLKILKPVSKLFFSEASQRRKSAMNILRKRRGLSRLGAIWFGLKSRARSFGAVRSVAKTLAILAADSFRGSGLLFARLALIYPFKLVRKTIKLLPGQRDKKRMPEL